MQDLHLTCLRTQLLPLVEAYSEHFKAQAEEVSILDYGFTQKSQHAYIVLEWLDTVDEAFLEHLNTDIYILDYCVYSNHAVSWIRQAISRALIDQGRTIRVPVYVRTLLARMTRLSARLFEEQGKEPTLVQLAEAMDLSLEQVQLLTGINELPISLDQHISAHDERTTLADVIADTSTPAPEEAFERRAERYELPQAITGALSCLTSREHQAITLRFGLFGNKQQTLSEVGEQMHLSRERVRQLEARALEKLRHSDQACLLSHYLY